jgi:hypothetical protein
MSLRILAADEGWPDGTAANSRRRFNLIVFPLWPAGFAGRHLALRDHLAHEFRLGGNRPRWPKDDLCFQFDSFSNSCGLIQVRVSAERMHASSTAIVFRVVPAAYFSGFVVQSARSNCLRRICSSLISLRPRLNDARKFSGLTHNEPALKSVQGATVANKPRVKFWPFSKYS